MGIKHKYQGTGRIKQNAIESMKNVIIFKNNGVNINSQFQSQYMLITIIAEDFSISKNDDFMVHKRKFFVKKHSFKMIRYSKSDNFSFNIKSIQ